ncbi:lysophospholipid acyltransferase family protein [Sphingomonas paeninsulae]|nr:1-acyl-sn-glycerol-3-phosphate acyltransferase [Sphingomonas paeninsulae]
MASRSTARADSDGKFAGNFRLAMRLTFLALALAMALPLHFLFRTLGFQSPCPRLFLKSVARICGAVVSTQGARLKSDVFYVSNHITWLDVPVLAGATGAAFVAQSAIAGWPLIGWLSKLNRTVFVARADRMTIAQQVETLRDALNHHQPIVVFPEGTTTDGQSLLPFKPPLFAVVTPPPRPMMVQPVLIDYRNMVPEFAWVDDEGVGQNAVRLLSRRGTFPVCVIFLDSIDPAAFPDRKAIAAESQKRIADALAASLSRVAIV